jgi:hypothetical protein
VDEILHVEGSCSDEERRRWMTLFLDIQKSEMTFFFAHTKCGGKKGLIKKG